MGYKQELKRNFNTIEIFGIAFSIMGLLPSIASTLAFSLPAGPAGMVWRYFSRIPARMHVGSPAHLTLSQLVSRIGLHLSRSAWPWQTWICDADVGRAVLVDALLCLAEDQKLPLLPGRVQQHTGPDRRVV